MKSKLLLLAFVGTALTGLATAGETVKVAYAYTSSVSSYYGGDENTKSKITSRHNTTNALHTNSATGVTFVVGTRVKTLTYTRTNVTASEALADLRNVADLKGVRDSRDATQSDLLQLFCDWTNTNIVGLAGEPGYASVVLKSALGGTGPIATVASGHELGHCMNAAHANGFCTQNLKRTVMAGTSSCSGSSVINYFSSSSRIYYFGNNGAAPLGDRTHNNRERVIAQAPTTARYK
jgi:hypothetical protein